MNAVEAAGLTKKLLDAKKQLKNAGPVTRIAITGTILELRKKLGAWKRVKVVLDRLVANPFDGSKNLVPSEYVDQVKSWLPDSLICFKKMEAGNAKGTAQALSEVLGRYPELANYSGMKIFGTGAELLDERKKRLKKIDQKVDEVIANSDLSEIENEAGNSFDRRVSGIIYYARWDPRPGEYVARFFGVNSDKSVKDHLKKNGRGIPSDLIEVIRQAYIKRNVRTSVEVELNKKYPNMYVVGIPKFRGMNTSERTYALYANGYGVIMTSQFKGNLTNSVQSDEESNYHPAGLVEPDSPSDGARSIIAHELGHAMDAMLDLRVHSEIRDLWRTHKKTIGADLSRYAGANVQEMIAEAFCEYMIRETPRPLAQKIGQIIDKEYASRFGG